MKIILLKEVRGLGRIGEIKEVSAGYARNYLIPGGLADMATKHSLNVLKAQGNKIVKQRKQAQEKKKKMAKKISRQKFVVKMKADEKGSLYAKLDAKAIALELAKNNFKVEPDEIILNEPIKALGEYEIKLEMAGEKASIKLAVKKEKIMEVKI